MAKKYRKKPKIRTIYLNNQYNNDNISKKEMLMIAWNYFQQHAQQRISYFNFFVAFSALITTGMISTFQEDYKYHIVGFF